MRDYYSQFLKSLTTDTTRALRQRWLWSLGILIATLVIALVFVGGEAQDRIIASVLISLAATGAMMGVLLISTILGTPVNLARLQDERIKTLDEKLKALDEERNPTLAMQIDGPRPAPERVAQWLRIRVDNIGVTAARDCAGKVISVAPQPPLVLLPERIPEPGQNLRWSTRGGGQGGTKVTIGPGSHEYLDLAFAMRDHRPGCFFLGFPDWEPWPLLDGVYHIDILVSAIDSLPLTAVYRIEKRGVMNLSIEQMH